MPAANPRSASLTLEDGSHQPSGGMPDTDPRPSEPGARGPSLNDDDELADAPAGIAARILGRFTILSRLGQGGMGVVWGAYDPALDRRVALKVLHPGRDSDAVRARIIREAKAMAKLSHPNVAQVFEVGQEGSCTYVAMEFIRGQNLRQWLREATRSHAQILEIYLQAAAGLSCAHGAGLIHRDFKPDNAMIGADGRVRVLDFGLVRIDRESATSGADPEGFARDPIPDEPELALTREGAVMGTPAYMAPEQLLGEPIDARADQFSLCVALWEALVGARPFPSHSRAELIEAVTRGRPPTAPKDAHVPTWILAALRRGLSVDPCSRFASIDELRAALQDDPARRRRRRWLIAVGAGVIACGLGAWQLEELRRAKACVDDAASISTSWGDDARQRVRAALLDTEIAGAPLTAALVERSLDRWAERWSTARGDSCKIAQARGEDLAVRATSCLREHREALVALVGALEQADTPVVHAAGSAVLKLPDPLECDDPSYLQLLPAFSGEDAALAAALRQQLAASEGLAVIARHTQSLAIAERVLAQAEAADLPAVEARALARVGQERAALGEYEPAQLAYEASLKLAMATGDDVASVDAMMGLISVLGSRGAIDRAMWLGEVATAMLFRIDDRDQLRAGALMNAIAIARRDRGDFAGDLDLLGRALAISEAALGPDHPEVASRLNNLASVHRNMGALSEASRQFERALEIRERTLGPDHPLVAKSLNNLGSTLGLLGERERAREVLGRSLAIWERTLGPDHPEMTLALDNLAYLHYVEGDFAGAAPLVERSLAILVRAHGDQPTVAETQGNLARLYLATGALDRAEALLRDTIRILDASLGADHFSSASHVAGLAEVARGRGDHRVAAETFERALALYQQGGTDQRWIAETRFDLARSMWDAGMDRDRALALAREAAAGGRAADGADLAVIAGFDAWIAEHESKSTSAFPPSAFPKGM